MKQHSVSDDDDWPSEEEMDAIDAPLAQEILDEIERDPRQMVSGEELECWLEEPSLEK